MKRYSILICILLGLLFKNCGNNFPPYVDSKARVLDSIYSENKASIERFFAKIETLDIKESLSKPVILLDSLEDENEELSLPELKEPYIKDSLDITAENMVIVNNITNLNSYKFKSDSLLNSYKTDYLITGFNSDYSGKVNPYDGTPNYYDFYNDKDFFKTYTDSIHQEEKLRLINNETIAIQKLDSIKYVVLVNDLIYKDGKLLNKNEFESGLVVSDVKLYNLNNKEIIGEELLVVSNKDKVAHMFTIDFGGDMTTNAINHMIKEDLAEQKNKAIIEYLSLD